ncbi:hypothetical protein ACJRO7_016437 [Eucalyptus globulus]|uniref:RING-type domain-containing protein n=1 Tax=Eucalyptus globulus TaxID=34317 RepID=A0ABD3L745_EUCGL
MAEKFCKYFVFRDEEDGGLLPKGLSLIKLHLYEGFFTKDPESGRLLVLDHLGRERLISLRLDINNIRCDERCAIEEAVHPHLIDIGVPERMQADILDKIASSRHLRDWRKTNRVPPIRVNVGVGTTVEDYKPGADAGERPRLVNSPYGVVTLEAGEKVRCLICWEECTDDGTSFLSLPCTHAFHDDCLVERVLRTHSRECPVCRAAF